MKELAKKVYRPEGEIKAAVFIVHGMEEHQRRYQAFAQYLNTKGIGVITYDLPGHGETDPEERGWFGEKNGWDCLVNSAVEIGVLTKKEFPNVPVFYFGHSMGTMIGRTFLQKNDGLIDGIILSGVPNYTPAASAGVVLAKSIALEKGKKGHSKLLDTMATGSFNNVIENPRTPVDWLSYNEENVDRYIEDPDCGFPFTIQGYVDLFEGMLAMHDVKRFRCTKPELPIYVFAGEDDPCIGGKEGFDDSVNTLSKAGYETIETKLYPNMRHETLNETDCITVFEDVSAWILAHSA